MTANANPKPFNASDGLVVRNVKRNAVGSGEQLSLQMTLEGGRHDNTNRHHHHHVDNIVCTFFTNKHQLLSFGSPAIRHKIKKSNGRAEFAEIFCRSKEHAQITVKTPDSSSSSSSSMPISSSRSLPSAFIWRMYASSRSSSSDGIMSSVYDTFDSVSWQHRHVRDNFDYSVRNHKIKARALKWIW